MRDLYSTLTSHYQAQSMAVIPGGGSFGMESIARQFANDETCLVIRNGWFSYRWSQILETGKIARAVEVLKAEADSSGAFQPAPLDQVLESIKSNQPRVVFMPHVETASGILLPDAYVQAVAKATHDNGGLLVLDCVASGALWVDMKAAGVDVLLSAPQKGWSGSPCAGVVMLSELALERLEATESTSFAADLKKWHQIMMAYVQGGHAYHATMPTDALLNFNDQVQQTLSCGAEDLKQAQIRLGSEIRKRIEGYGFGSVAAQGYQSPTVVVSYTASDAIHSGKGFAALGLQTAQGVPLMCDESSDFKTFRVGLFGLDKLTNIPRTVDLLVEALESLTQPA